jgi:hypothetical protein
MKFPVATVGKVHLNRAQAGGGFRRGRILDTASP